MKITLTEKQVRQLVPYFDRVNVAARLGAPGMLVCQIRWDNSAQRYWMEPGFLAHQHALCITEKGQTCSPAPLPTELADSTVPRCVESAPDTQAGLPETGSQVSQ